MKSLYYIFCFPRSGSSYLYHICQQFWDSNRKIDKYNPEGVFFHTHQSKDILETDQKLIYIVRDYKECCLSHAKRVKEKHRQKRSDYQLALNLLTTDNINFCSIVKTYDVFKGKKLLIYYEDLITNINNELIRIGQFLDRPEKIKQISNNISEITKESINQYKKINGILSLKNLKFHQNQLTRLQKQEMDNTVLKVLDSKLFNKYLLRYK